MQKEEGPLQLKIVFTGDMGVGKTTLISFIALGLQMVQFSQSIGLDFRVKDYMVGKENVKVSYWDTVGAERFSSLKQPLFSYAHVVCLCYSLNDRATFLNLPNRIEKIRKNTKCLIYLVGCKSDLKHQVSIQEIQKFASTQSLPFFQTSVKENVGIDENFTKMVQQATKNFFSENEYKRNNVRIKVNPPPKVSKTKTCAT